MVREEKMIFIETLNEASVSVAHGSDLEACAWHDSLETTHKH